MESREVKARRGATALAYAVVVLIVSLAVLSITLDGGGRASAAVSAGGADSVRASGQAGVAGVGNGSAGLGSEADGRGGLQLVLTYDDGSIARGLGCRVSEMYWSGSRVIRRVVTDDQGIVRFTGLPAGKHAVYLDRASLTEISPLTVRPGRTLEVPVVIRVNLKVSGTVRGPDGRAVSGAEIVLRRAMDIERNVVVVAVSGKDGRYSLKSGFSACGLAARAPGLCTSRTVPVRRGLDGVEVVDFTLPKAAARLQGRVRCGEAPVAGAAVRVFAVAHDPALLGVEGDPPYVEAWTDEFGRFRVDHVYPGSTEVSVRAVGYASWTKVVDASLASETSVDVELQKGSGVRCYVRSASDGRPVSGAQLDIRTSAEGVALAHAFTNSNGLCVLPDLPSGPVEIAASKPGQGKGRVQLQCVSGDTVTVSIELELGRVVHGTVIERGRDPVRHAEVKLIHHESETLVASVETDSAGKFVATNVPAGRVAIEVTHESIESTWMSIEMSERQIEDRDVSIVAEGRGLPISRIEGRIAGVGRDPFDGAVVHLRRFGGVGYDRSVTVNSKDGRFVLGAVRPGSYTMFVNAGSSPAIVREMLRIEEGETRDVGVIEPSLGGRFEVHGSDHEDGVKFELWTQSRKFVMAKHGPDGTSRPVHPGFYRLVRVGSSPRVGTQVEIRAGEVTPVRFASTNGCPCVVKLGRAKGARHAGWMCRIELHEVPGFLGRSTQWVPPGETREFAFGRLVPGRYRLRVLGFGTVTEQEFEVPHGATTREVAVSIDK